MTFLPEFLSYNNEQIASLECLELVREALTIGHTLEALTIGHTLMRFFNNAMGSFDPSRVFFDPGT